MGAARPILGLVALILLAGGLLLQFLIILSGTNEHNPLNRVYFLQSTTDGITGARNPSRWTYFAMCGVVNGKNGNCGSIVPAFSFDPPRNFGTTVAGFGSGSSDKYFYDLSRFAWVFFLMGLFFAGIALLLSLLALCSRLGAKFTGMLVWLAVLFEGLGAALMTAWVVQGRKHFNSNGQTAKIGTYAMGFIWGAFACYFIAAALYNMAGAVGSDRTPSSGRSRFGRSKSTRSRGTFIDEAESQHRVKDEYE